MPKHDHAQQFQSVPFNPLPDYHVMHDALPRIAQVYDFAGKHDYTPQGRLKAERFDPTTAGNLEGQLHFAMAVDAADGNAAALVEHCKEALLCRLFGEVSSKDLSHEQERQRAFIIGLMCDLAEAFYQPEPQELKFTQAQHQHDNASDLDGEASA